jgi:hypothetical protein
MTIPVTTTNADGVDVELALFVQEQFGSGSEAETEMTSSSDGKEDQPAWLFSDTAIQIAPPESNTIPPQPQQMQRDVHDDRLIQWCDDCRVDGCCCNLRQFTVLMYCPIFVGMGIGIWFGSMHFGYDTVGLILTIGTAVIWLAYLSFFLRLARHGPIVPTTISPGFMYGSKCILYQLCTVTFCPIMAAWGIGLVVLTLGNSTFGLVWMLGGWLICFIFIVVLQRYQRSHFRAGGVSEWTGQAMAWGLGDGSEGSGGGEGGGGCGGGGCGA